MSKSEMPSIRFYCFDDAWEQRKLGDLATEFKSGDNLKSDKITVIGKYPVYGGNGLRGYTDCFNHNGEFALIGRQGALCGNVNFSRGKAYFTEHAVAVKANSTNNTQFLYYMLGNMNLGQYSGQSAQPGLAVNKLVGLFSFVPEKDEQQQIGAFFYTLDNLITLHQRKFEKLTNVKKLMLEKMFPQNGSSYPEIRFKGFTDPWEQRKFGEVFMSLQNNTLSRAELNDKFGAAQNIHYGDVLIKYDEILDVSKEPLSYIEKQSIADKFKTSYLQNGDVIIADTAEDETVGKCTEIEGLTDQKVISGLHTMPVRPNRKFASGFLGFYLNSAAYHDQLKPLMQGIKVTSISKGAMQDTVVKFPLDLKEQEQIGIYFGGLDHLITLHQRELEKLQNIKKALLEKMFV